MDQFTGEAKNSKKLRTHLHQFYVSKDEAGALSCYAACAYAKEFEVGPLKVTLIACIDHLADTFGVSTSNPNPTLTSVNISPNRNEDGIGGGLLWIASANLPDIANTVREVARDPNARPWQVILKIIQYLQGTHGLGIM